MNFLRKILFPFAILYGFITSIRNYLYDKGILKSYSFELPIIAVGNLSVGGTGKTPQIEYLIRLLSKDYKIAILSRGYKRKSNGFILADATATAEILGDEPFQIFQKFSQIQVAVDTDRKNGIEQLLLQRNKPDIILLDDAFQHRRVKAGFYVLLTAYNDLFSDDFMLPTGNLRETKNGVKRADVIIVTKCPKDISEEKRIEIKAKINFTSKQKLYFSTIEFDTNVYGEKDTLKLDDINNQSKVLVAGIANPQSFFEFLKNDKTKTMSFSDHHDFSKKEIQEIKQKAKTNLIITTEKDFVRLKGKLPKEQLYYLPIKSVFIEEANDFDKKIINYVGKSSRNSNIH